MTKVEKLAGFVTQARYDAVSERARRQLKMRVVATDKTDPPVASPPEVTEIAVSPAEPVVPEVHSKARAKRSDLHGSGRAGRAGSPMDPQRRAAVALSRRPCRHAADCDSAFGDDPACLLGAPPLNSALHGPRGVIGEAIRMQRLDALQDRDGWQTGFLA